MNKPDSQSSLTQWVDWLLHLHAQEIDLGLARIRLVAESMGLLNPEAVVISVAGTNGKGSSVAMLSAILSAAGYRVGTYTSPHIIRFNERIKIDDKPVSDRLIIDAFSSIEAQRQDTKLTFFEFSTLAALKIFNESQLDVIVLEVGLGGRLDAVNVVDADAALITSIDVDHVDWLGDDRNQIALEKAGIMRSGNIAVCSDPTVPFSLIDYASDNKVDLSLLGKDYFYDVVDDNFWKLTVSGVDKRLLKPALQGSFQVQNAAGVIHLLERLDSKIPLTRDALNRGLGNVSHPGRLETKVLGHQRWLIDVAHNPQSAAVLAEFLQEKCGPKRVALFSALDDKDMLAMVKAIAPFVSSWFVADLNVPRASSVEKLRSILDEAKVCSTHVICCPSVADGVKQITKCTENDVLVWGSFFTVSQSLNALNQAEI